MNDEVKLSAEVISGAIKTRFIGQKIIYFPSLESTMDAARREARWGAPAGTVILAGEQTAARGRLRRAWISPQGGLPLSIILRPNENYLPEMIMLASLSVSLAIEQVTGIKTGIKWPNDILIKDKKVSGILIENDISKNKLVHTVMGIGINVNMHIKDFPEIASTATSLSDQLGRAVSRIDVAVRLLEEMEKLYLILTHGNSLFGQWEDRLVTLGQSVQVTLGDRVYYGVAESVARDGSLMVREEDNRLTKIMAGDVTLRKLD